MCSLALRPTNIGTGPVEPDLVQVQKIPCYLKEALDLLFPSYYLLHLPVSTFNHKATEEKISALPTWSPFPMPPLINPNMASSEFQVSVGILAQYPQPPPPKLPTTVPPNLTIVSFRGHLTDKDRCCFRGKERKWCIFFPQEVQHSPQMLFSHSHSQHPRGAWWYHLSWLYGWRIEPYTRAAGSDSAAGTQRFSSFLD